MESKIGVIIIMFSPDFLFPALLVFPPPILATFHSANVFVVCLMSDRQSEKNAHGQVWQDSIIIANSLETDLHEDACTERKSLSFNTVLPEYFAGEKP